MKAYDVILTGTVQGVGFRYYTRMTANRLRVSGWVRNCPDGSVQIHCEGDEEALGQFLEAVRKGPAGAAVTGADIREGALAFHYGFEIH